MMTTIPFPFIEPSAPLSTRRHGPRGYTTYQSYKPWLRDEHEFRCSYCLSRERWNLQLTTPSDGFGADHMKCQRDCLKSSPALITDYSNLCYCCNSCNSRKDAATLSSDLVDRPLSQHLRVESTGEVSALTTAGAWLERLLRLNNPKRVEQRKTILELWTNAEADAAAGRKTAVTELFSFPPDIPNLRLLKPPGGNARSMGVDDSAYERRRKGLLPDFQS